MKLGDQGFGRTHVFFAGACEGGVTFSRWHQLMGVQYEVTVHATTALTDEAEQSHFPSCR